MEKKNYSKEYMILVNGRPIFSCLDEATIPVVVADVRRRFGDEVPVKVSVHETFDYEPGPAGDN